MQHVILEVCDNNSSINLITSDLTEARQRLYDVACENDVLYDATHEHVMDGKLVGFRTADRSYSVELLDWKEQ